jgi:hypothetical protein
VRVLLDENVPIQALPILQRTLIGHQIDHVETINWKSKFDHHLLPDTAGRGYAAFVTKDANQLSDPKETRLIRKSKLHHIRFDQDQGVPGFARAVAAVVAAMPDVMKDLEAADGQRLVHISKMSPRKRHVLVNPKTHPPAYWHRTRT